MRTAEQLEQLRFELATQWTRGCLERELERYGSGQLFIADPATQQYVNAIRDELERRNKNR